MKAESSPSRSGKFRFVILVLGLLCLICLQANILVINMAFICMSSDPTGVYDSGNGTIANRFEYTPKEKGLVISVAAMGTISGAFLFNWLHQNYGARIPFFIAGLLSAICTAATPFLAEWSYTALIVGRFLLGVSFSADFAAAGVIVVAWAPLAETATFIGVLLAFGPISFSFVNPTVGAFCTSSLGWRGAFYAFGFTTVIVFMLWVLLYRDEPSQYKFVNKQELARIEENKTEEHKHRDGFVPYWDVCTNPAIIVVWLNSLAEVNTSLILLQYAPTYFSKVLGFTIAQTAILSSLGSMIHAPLKIIIAIISDNLKMNERVKLCIFNTIATAFAGFFCVCVGFAPTREWGVVAFTLTSVVMAANAAGFFKCAALVSRQYSHFVMSQMQMTKCVANMIGPTMVALLTTSDHDIQGWRTVYAVNCALLFAASIAFLPYSSAEPAPFTKITKESRRIEKEEKKAKKIAKVSIGTKNV